MVSTIKKIFLLFIFILSSNIVMASNTDIISGIEAYKNGNYSNCVEIMKSVVKDDPTTAIGYYYLGLAYTQQGKKILAVQNYNKVINLNSDSTLVKLAKQGKNNLGEKKVTAIESQLDDIEEDIRATESFSNEKLSPEELKAKYEDNIVKTEQVKNNDTQNVNSIKTTQVIKASDYAKQTQTNHNAEPTNDDIVNAIRTLQKAGLLQNGAAGLTGGMGNNNVPIDARTQQMNSMLMMMNGNNGGNNMNMMQMLPYMNNGGKVDPQVMQMMLMNQMMPNFSSGNSNNGY